MWLAGDVVKAIKQFTFLYWMILVLNLICFCFEVFLAVRSSFPSFSKSKSPKLLRVCTNCSRKLLLQSQLHRQSTTLFFIHKKLLQSCLYRPIQNLAPQQRNHSLKSSNLLLWDCLHCSIHDITSSVQSTNLLFIHEITSPIHKIAPPVAACSNPRLVYLFLKYCCKSKKTVVLVFPQTKNIYIFLFPRIK